MIGRALALGLATLLLATPVAFADEASDSMADVDIPDEEEDEAEPVNWGRTGLYLEAGGMVIVEDFRTRTNPPQAVSGTTGAISVRAGWRPGRPLAFEAQYERVWDLFEANDANLITLNAKYLMLTDRRYQPFIRTGFGAIWGKLPHKWTRKGGTGASPEQLDAQSSFVWKIGGGLDYGITRHLTASLSADYVIPTQEFHRLNYWAVGFAARYKF